VRVTSIQARICRMRGHEWRTAPHPVADTKVLAVASMHGAKHVIGDFGLSTCSRCGRRENTRMKAVRLSDNRVMLQPSLMVLRFDGSGVPKEEPHKWTNSLLA
jgi:hypothetical protein